ncbi:phosphatase PAP2 family protein [Candidatus Woesearchaeota archaeon]|nr:phosphatase PAP2 family protein [Candidatus Woesearchaeota archaeon]
MKKEYLIKGIWFFAIFLLIYTIVNMLSIGRSYFHFAFAFEETMKVIPVFLIFYVSSYIIIAMPFFVLKRSYEIRKLVYVYWTIAIISFIIFLLIPAKVVRPVVIDGFFAWVLNTFWTYFDLPYNSLPSLHISLSFAAAYLMRKHLNFVYLLLWVLLIAISTILTKQHYILDIVTGLALSILVLSLFRKEP